MPTKALLLATTILTLSACATGPQQAPAPAEMVTVAGPTVYQNVPVAVPTSFKLPDDSKPAPKEKNPQKTARDAAANGMVVPDPNDYVGAVYTPAYYHDFWYTFYTAEGDQSDIEFSPGEVLRSMSCPDSGTVFTLTHSQFGPDNSLTDQVHVKAKRAGAKLQCTFNTSFGPYRVQIISNRSTKHVALRWTHPGPTLVEIAKTDRSKVQSDFAVCGAGADKGYKLSGDLDEWGLRQGDVRQDGKRTCITFPPTIGANGGPVVFILDDQDNRRPANPTVIGSDYVIDGVQKRFELRMGAKSVLIEKESR